MVLRYVGRGPLPWRYHNHLSYNVWAGFDRRYPTIHLKQSRRSLSSAQNLRHTTRRRSQRWLIYPVAAILLAGGTYIAFRNYKPFRHSCIAIMRCSRVADAAVRGAIDYKRTLARQFDSDEERNQAYSECHQRSAERVLKALLTNGGIFIKLGQHMASLVVLPKEWTNTMRPLQDKCDPSRYEDLQELFLADGGLPIEEIFEEFNPNPIGVASLAQVHVARHKESGKKVAVKIQHPHLAEFCDVDMEMVEVTLGWIKYWFPEFEFTWLGEEMRVNLPKEMDFVREALNAARAKKDFENVPTSLYIPEVLLASKRVLIMEYIQGGRVDDLAYLADNRINRNQVALELSRIFNRMVFINGFFHADPHAGNILIRPSSPLSLSPYNFEIVLLDHGLYFDLDTELRVNYSKLWLSLIAPISPQVSADRRKYAQLVGNIGPDLYPVFEAAITGRATLEGSWEDVDNGSSKHGSTLRRAKSMIDMMPQTEEEMEAVRHAVVMQEGLLLSVFDVLRTVPRRVLMVLKLNDLTRSLDHALATTHSSVRIFLVTAKYCAYAIWEDERRHLINSMRERGLLSFSILRQYFVGWWTYQRLHGGVVALETFMDTQAYAIRVVAWVRGLCTRGLNGARLAAAGLT